MAPKRPNDGAHSIESRLRYYTHVFGPLTRHVTVRGIDGIEEQLVRVLTGLSRRRGRALARLEQERPGEDGRWFTATESALVGTLASLIVPSDDRGPGAKEAGAVETLDRLLAGSASRRSLYARGLLACDEWARREHGRIFVELTPEQQQALLRWVDSVHARWAGAASVTEKIRRRVVLLYMRWRCPVFELLPRLVQDVLDAFYTSQVSWEWLDYDGPPMPQGYPDLRERESRTPESTLEEASVVRPAGASGDRGATTEGKALSSLQQGAPAPDVIVIGSGAGGGVIAKELGEAGLSVVVLEAGRRFDPSTDYLTDRRDFELSALGVFDPEDERRDLYTSGGAKPFLYNRAKGVGGSTLHYLAISPRFHESDFRVYREDGVAADWPISYSELEPYYTLVEYELGVSGPFREDANPFDSPRTRPFPTAAHEFNRASRIVKRGADKLGLHMVREPVAIPTKDWNGRPACVEAGTCGLGCRVGAKSSIDVTYVPKAEATGRVEIRPECMAREITVGRDGKARSVVYFDAKGREHEISARAIVLAGNAVETPRLLLLSSSSRFPNGLANSSGLVGKHFMEHLALFAHGLFSERVDAWRGIPSGGMIQDYYATHRCNTFARGWTILVSSGLQWPLSVARHVPGWGAPHKTRTKDLFGHVVRVVSVGEQLPDVRNQVILDPVVKDSYGLPVPRLTNELRENDQAMLRAISKSLQDLLRAAGATEVWEEYRPGRSAHYLGTCRMGSHPNTSVVDSWGRTHDVPNLFIGDGSVCVTGAAVNPALTISALATRTAEGIAAAFQRGEL